MNDPFHRPESRMDRAYLSANNGCIYDSNGFEDGPITIERVCKGLAVYSSLVEPTLLNSRLANLFMPKTQRQVARATELLELIVQARRKALSEGDSEVVSPPLGFQVRKDSQSSTTLSLTT